MLLRIKKMQKVLRYTRDYTAENALIFTILCCIKLLFTFSKRLYAVIYTVIFLDVKTKPTW